MPSPTAPIQRPPLGIYKLKETINRPIKEYKPKVIIPKVKDPLETIKPREYHVKEYKGADPTIDPLTDLPYNEIVHTSTKSKSKNFPKAFGSPVKSISRTLKLFESIDHVVKTTAGRLAEVSRAHDTSRDKSPHRERYPEQHDFEEDEKENAQ